MKILKNDIIILFKLSVMGNTVKKVEQTGQTAQTGRYCGLCKQFIPEFRPLGSMTCHLCVYSLTDFIPIEKDCDSCLVVTLRKHPDELLYCVNCLDFDTWDWG